MNDQYTLFAANPFYHFFHYYIYPTQEEVEAAIIALQSYHDALYEYERAKAIVERAVGIYILDKDCPNLFEWITPYFYACFLANLYFFLEKVEEEEN